MLRPPQPHRRLALAGGAAAAAAAALAAAASVRGRPRGRDAPPRPEGAREPGPAGQALAGACAGGAARLCVAPLDVVKIRLQVQLEPVGGGPGSGKYRGTGQALALIWREEGLRGMWRGTLPALLLWVPYTAVQFATLGQLNRVRRARVCNLC